MSEQRERSALVRGWVVKAEHDLRNAEHTLTLDEDCPFDTVAFHAQQCVEKYLKALLTFREIPYPRIHDISELVALVPVALVLKEIVELQPYAVEARYPGEWDEIDADEARNAVAIAQRAREVIRPLLPPDALL